jgi:hypothetical protein
MARIRRLLGELSFRLARGTQKVSLFFGGISALGLVVAVIMLIFNSKHGAAHYGEYTVRRWLWLFPAKGAIYLSQVDGRGGQPTLGQGKPSTGRRVARARGRDASSRADAQIAHVVVLSLS